MKDRFALFARSGIAAYISIVLTLVFVQLFAQSRHYASFYQVYAATELYFWRYILNEFLCILLVGGLFSLLVGSVKALKWKKGVETSLILLFLFAPVLFFVSSWKLFISQSVFINKASIRMVESDWFRLIMHALELQGLSILVDALGVLVLLALIGLMFGGTERVLKRLKSSYIAIAWLMFGVGIMGAYVYKPIIFNAEELSKIASDDLRRVGFYHHMQKSYKQRLGPWTSLWYSLSTSFNFDNLKPFDFNVEPFVDRVPLPAEAGWIDLNTQNKSLKEYNVILLIVESLRDDVLDAEVNGIKAMPHLSELSKQSSLFRRHYSSSSYSSYADIVPISSQSVIREEAQHFYTPMHAYPRPRIYDVLDRFGYKTAIISSQDERWGGMINYLKSDNIDAFLHAGDSDINLYADEADMGFSRYAKVMKSGKVDDALTIHRLTEWIGQQEEEPFFVYSNLQNSHFPYRVGEGFKRPFIKEIKYAGVGFNSMTVEMLPEMVLRYFDSLNYVDAQIGVLIDYLKKSGQWNNTILVVTGDTGQAFLEHGYSNHGGPLYDEVLRTPLLIHGPAEFHSHVGEYAFYTSHINIAPTLLAMLGLPDFPGFQGESLFKDGRFQDSDVPHFMAVQSPLAEQFAILYRGKKLIYDPALETKEIYDLKEDPLERNNIYDPTDKMHQFMEKLLAEHIKQQFDYYSDENQYSEFFPPKLDYEGLYEYFFNAHRD